MTEHFPLPASRLRNALPVPIANTDAVLSFKKGLPRPTFSQNCSWFSLNHCVLLPSSALYPLVNWRYTNLALLWPPHDTCVTLTSFLTQPHPVNPPSPFSHKVLTSKFLNRADASFSSVFFTHNKRKQSVTGRGLSTVPPGCRISLATAMILRISKGERGREKKTSQTELVCGWVQAIISFFSFFYWHKRETPQSWMPFYTL